MRSGNRTCPLGALSQEVFLSPRTAAAPGVFCQTRRDRGDRGLSPGLSGSAGLREPPRPPWAASHRVRSWRDPRAPGWSARGCPPWAGAARLRGGSPSWPGGPRAWRAPPRPRVPSCSPAPAREAGAPAVAALGAERWRQVRLQKPAEPSARVFQVGGVSSSVASHWPSEGIGTPKTNQTPPSSPCSQWEEGGGLRRQAWGSVKCAAEAAPRGACGKGARGSHGVSPIPWDHPWAPGAAGAAAAAEGLGWARRRWEPRGSPHRAGAAGGRGETRWRRLRGFFFPLSRRDPRSGRELDAACALRRSRWGALEPAHGRCFSRQRCSSGSSRERFTPV